MQLYEISHSVMNDELSTEEFEFSLLIATWKELQSCEWSRKHNTIRKGI